MNIDYINVLVVEGDNFQRLALVDILTLCDYQVTVFENGRQARDELLKGDSDFDAILLDLNASQINGFELLCFLQEYEHLKTIPILMMSFSGDEENIAKCLVNGAKDYLLKPLRIQNVMGSQLFKLMKVSIQYILNFYIRFNMNLYKIHSKIIKYRFVKLNNLHLENLKYQNYINIQIIYFTQKVQKNMFIQTNKKNIMFQDFLIKVKVVLQNQFLIDMMENYMLKRLQLLIVLMQRKGKLQLLLQQFAIMIHMLKMVK